MGLLNRLLDGVFWLLTLAVLLPSTAVLWLVGAGLRSSVIFRLSLKDLWRGGRAAAGNYAMNARPGEYARKRHLGPDTPPAGRPGARPRPIAGGPRPGGR